jgi:hypothetical protein
VSTDQPAARFTQPRVASAMFNGVPPVNLFFDTAA